jgi:hypothetical protein
MSALQLLAIDEMLLRGSIKDVDVLRLRSAVYNDGVMTAEEAEALFKLTETCTLQDPAWVDFYIEALTDYLVHQAEPEGYLTAEDAHRLIARIASVGKIERKSDFDLVLNVLDKSRWSPVSLSRFALQQIKRAVVDGDGPLRVGQPQQHGKINEPEVEVARRILYAFGGDGSVAVTRPEAEVLFDINDAIGDPQANPAWTDLFVKAVTNVVMAASGQAVPTREEALRRDAWLIEGRGELSPLALLSAMVTSSIDAVRATYQEQSSEERALARLERQRIEIITNEEITQAEAAWLSERIGRDGHLTANEAALVAYLKKESPKIHPDLQAAVERLAQAA